MTLKIVCAILILFVVPSANPTSAATNTRMIEFRFQLSADPASEFSASLPIHCQGSIVAHAEWGPLDPSAAHSTRQTMLNLVLLRPNGAEAARTGGTSPLRFEMRVSEQDLAALNDRAGSSWTVKIVHGAGEDRAEVRGLLRVTVPVPAGTLADTSFTLLGSGNAQEIPLTVSVPGRLLVGVDWRSDASSGAKTKHAPLSLSLIHTGENRTYARRRGATPLKIEQQVTEQCLDRGVRWVVRVHNDGQTRVRGSLKVTFTPNL